MKGVLLVNLGSPDTPEPADVKNYLREFLMDERVIDFPYLVRSLLVKGIILASFASSLGALVCFLISRYLFKNFIERKFNKALKIINAGIAKDGIYYLFFVRMTPIFPFFLINLLFSVTRIKALQFYIVSQIGMLLGTLLFINAGTQLAKINSIEDIFNKYVIISLVLIALIPIVLKKIYVYYKS